MLTGKLQRSASLPGQLLPKGDLSKQQQGPRLLLACLLQAFPLQQLPGNCPSSQHRVTTVVRPVCGSAQLNQPTAGMLLEACMRLQASQEMVAVLWQT
jgi:hypothetical protein